MDSRQVSQLTAGLMVVLFGCLLLAGQLDVTDVSKMWPAVFLVLALSQLMSTGDQNRFASASWFLFLAAIFFMHNFRILRLHDSWPLFVVAAGVGMVIGRRGRPSCDNRAGSQQS